MMMMMRGRGRRRVIVMMMMMMVMPTMIIETISRSRPLFKYSNCKSRTREPKLINFTLIAFLLGTRGQGTVFAQI